MADPLHLAAWNRFSYAHNAPTNYVDPSGHLAWWAPFAIGFIIGSLTNVGAHALQSDDPWAYLQSQEAGIDLLVGGSFGVLAVGVTSSATIIGTAAGLSTGEILSMEALSLGIANAAQGEVSTSLKHNYLDYEKKHSTLEDLLTDFAYGFVSPYLAYGGIRVAKWSASKALGYATHSRLSWLREFAYEMHRGTRTWLRFQALKRPEEIMWWSKQSDDFVMGSFGRMLGLVSYGFSLPTGFSYNYIYTHSNFLPYVATRTISHIDPLRP